uniref:DUF4333 domain-containing protein n=1 Tax=Anisakis simplex TaxID=6269 RepID=A0A0M3JJZ9_ANISI
LVGAPRADSGQPGTVNAGAVYSCPITATYTNRGKQWCEQIVVEYADSERMKEPVGYVHGRQLHFEGKNRQLLGAVVASSGLRNGIA